MHTRRFAHRRSRWRSAPALLLRQCAAGLDYLFRSVNACKNALGYGATVQKSLGAHHRIDLPVPLGAATMKKLLLAYSASFLLGLMAVVIHLYVYHFGLFWYASIVLSFLLFWFVTRAAGMGTKVRVSNGLLAATLPFILVLVYIFICNANGNCP
jgi:hypothetical protein